MSFTAEAAASLSVTDRATIANMAPEYGATMGFFPVDEETCVYLTATGRTEEQVEAVRNYFKAQGMFGIPKRVNVSTACSSIWISAASSQASPVRNAPGSNRVIRIEGTIL